MICEVPRPLDHRLEADCRLLFFCRRAGAKGKVYCAPCSTSSCLVVICLLSVILAVERSSIVAKGVQTKTFLHFVDESRLFANLICPHWKLIVISVISFFIFLINTQTFEAIIWQGVVCVFKDPLSGKLLASSGYRLMCCDRLLCNLLVVLVLAHDFCRSANEV